MSVFFILLGIALVLSGPVAILLALLTRRELRAAQARIRSLEAGRGPAPAPGATTARSVHPTPLPPTPATVAPAGRPREETGTASSSPPKARVEPHVDLETLIGGQWLTWLGVLALFFGTAFFLAQDLGEHPLAGVGQVLTGVLVGAVFIAVGLVLARRTQWVLGRGLLGGGVTLLFLAAYASYAFHRLVPASVVHVFLLGVALVGAGLAVRERSLAIATLTLVCALLTPALLRASIDPTRILFPYLLVVNAGTGFVTVRRRWPLLTLLGFAGTLLLVLEWWHHFYAIDRTATAFVAITPLWILFALLPILVARSSAGGTDRARPPWELAQSLLVALNGLSYTWFLYVLLAPFYADFRGVAIVALAFLYVLGARFAVRGHGTAATATHYTGVALSIIAVPVQFDAGWTTLAWTLLGLVLILAGLRHGSLFHRWVGLFVYVMAAFRVLAFDTAQTLGRGHVLARPVANASFLVGVLVAAILAITARLYHQHRVALSSLERPIVTWLALVAPALLLWRISVESLGAFNARELAARAPGSLRLPSLLTLSFIWAAFAALLIATGFLARYRPLRVLGFAVLAVLMLKVFLVDTQELDRGYRIASFVGVGGLLLAISVLYQRGRRR